MSLNIFDEARKIWNNIPKGQHVKDVKFNIEVHKKLLEVFQPGKFFYQINNVRTGIIELMSPEFEELLGYSLDNANFDFLINKIHPHDLPAFLNFEAAIEKFFSQVHGDKLLKYKPQYDYRVIRADGSYVRLLNQFVIIEHDTENVRTFVVNIDITHLKKEPKPVLSFIGLDGEPSFYNVDVQNIFKPVKQLFTSREQEVLRAIAHGMSSNDISKSLNISKLTVDSHRKNILKKADAKSTAEVIRMAFDNGWV